MTAQICANEVHIYLNPYHNSPSKDMKILFKIHEAYAILSWRSILEKCWLDFCMFIQTVNRTSLRNALEFASQYVEISYNIYAIWLMNTPHISIVFWVYNCRWQSIRVLDHFCFDDGMLSRLIRIAKIWSACKLAGDLTKTTVNYILGWSISYNKSFIWTKRD